MSWTRSLLQRTAAPSLSASRLHCTHPTLQYSARARSGMRPLSSTRTVAAAAATLFSCTVGASAVPKRRARPTQTGPSTKVGSEPASTSAEGANTIGAGEDAFFLCKQQNKLWLGVMDGVGGWQDMGVDPSVFSRGLAEHALEACKTSTNKTESPATILQTAYSAVQKDARIKLGSATALIASIDTATAEFAVANLGDSGYFIARAGQVLYASKPQTYFFNAPYQLAKMPDSMRRPGQLENKPADADLQTFQLQSGDTVVLATDGFFDNIFLEDALEYMKKSQQDAAKQAAALVKQAQMAGVSRTKNGPFSVEARQNRMRYDGGKEDDIAVIVLRVGEQGTGEKDSWLGAIKAKL
ncbi:phosphatase 2C-like domain-containing protein [Protomyces lactucae-debilis]|uniref:Protein phosphatase n=1 Tax=Protomyces lactucae-debilis TaxID=2754530 RepID=A0A1Y2FDH7_PROLT|nr:phosphatase 2C-like domain-containing protein [Protomyces lactucae-debilis]ORY81972.1 phosphatase 2C-like domain-containing protein [Protomyces lactucae-debilis]